MKVADAHIFITKDSFSNKARKLEAWRPKVQNTFNGIKEQDVFTCTMHASTVTRVRDVHKATLSPKSGTMVSLQPCFTFLPDFSKYKSYTESV
jgi:hypothetical protein